MHSPDIRLLTPSSPAELAAAREILAEYAHGLGIDLSFQNFDAELAALPGDYAEPAGALLLAYVGGELAGCGALRNLPDCDYPNACEMKRLYVRGTHRGSGLGRLIAQTLVDRAVTAGYSVMVLNTLDDMAAARGLYGALGFEQIPPYYYNPVRGAHYFKVDLALVPSRY